MGANRLRKILIVEDEALLRGLVAQFLRAEDFQVVEAGDGREGVDRFASARPFDLVLLDLNLPILPGVEVCRQIKQQHPSQPIIICSAAILDGHLQALTAMAVDQFLSKPYHPAELLRRIAAEIGRNAEPQPSTDAGILGPGWRTDPAHNRISRSRALFKLPAID
jgi:DNA-binding response OmpR family regulator